MTFNVSEAAMPVSNGVFTIWRLIGAANAVYPTKIVAEAAARMLFPDEDEARRYARLEFVQMFLPERGEAMPFDLELRIAVLEQKTLTYEQRLNADQRIESLEGKLNDLCNDIEKIGDDIADIRNDVDRLETDLDRVDADDRISTLESRVDDFADGQTENVKEIVRDALRNASDGI